LTAAARSELPAAVADSMRAWIPHHRVDQKREDALQMLCAIRRLLQEGLRPKAIDYYFERTLAWAQTQKDAQAAAGTKPTAAARLR